jgi:hypothetical protein
MEELEGHCKVVLTGFLPELVGKKGGGRGKGGGGTASE